MTARLKGGALRNEAGTPPDLFLTLHSEYLFTVDLCAVAHNHKLSDYLSPEDDALSLYWGGERGWCNPPYADIPAWLAKAYEPNFIAYLLPARTGRRWWQEWKPRAECHYFVGEKPERRIQFLPPPGVKYPSNPDCNVLFLFGEGTTPGLEVWRSGRTGRRL